MFPTSSQKKNWTFADEDTLAKFRRRTNQEFIQRYAPPDMNEQQLRDYFLTPEEERSLCRSYEVYLRDFCTKFQPPMPNYVAGTAFHYFKRFYLFNSVMDYHPREILVTCIYLACKIEEFNVSIHQFAANLSGDREQAIQIILNSELLIMSALKFHLTIHNPYRPVEGFFIDIKTRFPKVDPETLRSQVDEFLKKVFFTDAPLLYAPSQIALAGILQAGSRSKQPLDMYVTQTLIPDQATLPTVIEAIRTIRLIVRSSKDPPGPEVIHVLEEKLERCRNQENNPKSALYQAKMDEDGEEEMEQSFQANVNHVPGYQGSQL